MGAVHSNRLDDTHDCGEDVNFDHFQILRAIGKGSFGKVCIVEKKDTKQMFAMKYMNKNQCIERDALGNVLSEVDILTKLDHPFLVNIWFSFQDEEDLFVVTDLLLGGDLRYHMRRQDVHFDLTTVRLMICEIGLALNYLRTKRILHRDVKPDNILLDENGHFHLTDFNVATVLENQTSLATSVSGTRPYIAPEVFDCALDLCAGYSFPVDWWSLGIVAYEMIRGRRPFDIHSYTSSEDIKVIFNVGVHYPSTWDPSLVLLISKLLCINPLLRISNIEKLKQLECMQQMNMDEIYQKKFKPNFVPRSDHLNCDPTFELEEMIVETKPLHKKKKRLAKQRSLREFHTNIQTPDLDSPLDISHQNPIIPEFTIYNRYQEIERRRKESEWEKELELAMSLSNPLGDSIASSLSHQDTCCTSSPRMGTNSNDTLQNLNKIDNGDDTKVILNQVDASVLDLKETEPDLNKSDIDLLNVSSIESKLQKLDFIDRTPSPASEQ